MEGKKEKKYGREKRRKESKLVGYSEIFKEGRKAFRK